LITGTTGQDGSYLPELDDVVGGATKARRVLGWMPEVTFYERVEMMAETDMATHAGREVSWDFSRRTGGWSPEGRVS